LLHGLGSSAEDWAPQLGPLGVGHRLVLVDLPGHWRSAHPRGRLTVPAMGQRLEALLDRLGEPSVHVVGLSLGGCVGLELVSSTLNRGSRWRRRRLPFGADGNG